MDIGHLRAFNRFTVFRLGYISGALCAGLDGCAFFYFSLDTLCYFPRFLSRISCRMVERNRKTEKNEKKKKNGEKRTERHTAECAPNDFSVLPRCTIGHFALYPCAVCTNDGHFFFVFFVVHGIAPLSLVSAVRTRVSRLARSYRWDKMQQMKATARVHSHRFFFYFIYC